MKRKTNETTSGSIASVAGGGKPVDKSGVYKRKARRGDNLLSGTVNEEELAEDDLIIVPGKSKPRRNGLIPRDQVRTDHEVSMARSDLIQAHKSAKKIYHLLKDRTEEIGIEGWVQEKLIKANDYLNAVREYYEEQAVQSKLSSKYKSTDCGCDSDCDCRPDFKGMFQNLVGDDLDEANEKPMSPEEWVASVTKERPEIMAGERANLRYDAEQWGLSGPNAEKIAARLNRAYNDAANGPMPTPRKIFTAVLNATGRPNLDEKTRAALRDLLVVRFPEQFISKPKESVNEKKDACYSKVKSRYKVWPSAYASGALVKCRKVGAKNWGNKGKK